MKYKTVILVFIVLLMVFLVGLLPYFLAFRGTGISLDNGDWGQFGNYLTGIATLLNVGIFVIITVLVNQYNKNNKKQELHLSYKKELFNRFISAYEQLVCNSELLHINIRNLTYAPDSEAELPDCNVLAAHLKNLAVSFRTLGVTANLYIIDDEVNQAVRTIINNYLEEHVYPLINSMADSIMNEHVIRKINIANKEIPEVIINIGNTLKEYVRSNLQ